MKTALVSTLLLFTLSLSVLLPHTAVGNTSKLGLPEGAVARLGKGWVTGNITYSPDGSLFAVAQNIGIWLYDADTYEEQAFLRGHKDKVNSISFNRDGTMLVSGSDDGTVRVWDVKTATEKVTFIGQTRHGISSVAFSPDKVTVASGGTDGTVRLWDIKTETEKATQDYGNSFIQSVVFSPDGKTIAFYQGLNLYLQDVITERNRAILKGISRVSFSPDGKTFATLDRQQPSRVIRLWDVATLTVKATLSIEPYHVAIGTNSLSFSPDGKTIAVVGYEGQRHLNPLPKAWLWDVDTLTQKTTFIPNTDNNDSYFSNLDDWAGFESVSFSPDGKTIAVTGSGSGVSYINPFPRWWALYDVTTRKEKINSTGNRSISIYPLSLDFSPDGTMLASASWTTVHLWDVVSGTKIASFPGHTNTIRSVRFSPNGKTIASGSDDTTVRLWDVETETEIRTFIGHTYPVTSVSFGPKGETILSGSSSDARLWNIETGIQEAIFSDPKYWNIFDKATLSPDGKIIASINLIGHSTGIGTVRLWDIETGKLNTTLIGHKGWITSVSFSPDGKTIASSGGGSTSNSRNDGDRTVRLWDVETGTLKATFIGHTYGVNSASISPDGKTVASGAGGRLSWQADKTVRLWNVETETETASLIGHSDSITNVSFSSDGTLASASYDGTILLWDFSSMRTIQITPFPVESPAIGEQLTVQVSIASGSNVGGYQATVEFDPTALRYVESTKGDYLPESSFFIPPTFSENDSQITIGATSLTGVSQKTEGTLATLTFEVLTVKESTLGLTDVILTDIEGEHLLHFTLNGRVVEPVPLPSSAIVSVLPASLNSPEIGEEFVLTAEIVGGENIADYQLNWHYDETALEYVSGEKSSYIPNEGVGSGDGTLATATFRVKDFKTSVVSLSGVLTAPNGLTYLPTFESAEVIAPVFGDVNRDGAVDIRDLVLVATNFGKPVPEEGHPADVNGDGQINIVDLVKVAGVLGSGTSAPALLTQVQDIDLTKKDVENWLTRAQQQNLTDPISLKGIIFLEQLLAALTPKETALLPNYPNPFNPETWIPYQLATSADVSISIYTANGTLVRRLDLGHQAVGMYQHRSRAAHWDGKNDIGESVASGLYFYTLKAGDFTATRKMLILK